MSNDQDEYLNDLRDEERTRIAGCLTSKGEVAVFIRGWKYKDNMTPVVWQFVQIVINGRMAHELDLEGIAFLHSLLRVYVEAEQTEWLTRSISEYLETAKKWRCA